MCYLHNNVVDGDVDEFDEKSNKTHNTEPDSSCDGNLLELWKHKTNLIIIEIFVFWS